MLRLSCTSRVGASGNPRTSNLLDVLVGRACGHVASLLATWPAGGVYRNMLIFIGGLRPSEAREVWIVGFADKMSTYRHLVCICILQNFFLHILQKLKMAPVLSKDALMTVRLDELSDQDLVHLEEVLAPYEKYVVYREIADVTRKPHFQGYVACGTGDNAKEAKQRFVDMFRSTHKPSQRSFNQVRKIEKYMRYVAKDKDLVLRKGVTDEHIEQCERESFKKKDKLAEGNMVQRCYQTYVEEYRREPYPPGDNWRRRIARWIVADLAENNKPICVFQCRKWTNGVLAKLDGEFRDELVDEILSRL